MSIIYDVPLKDANGNTIIPLIDGSSGESHTDAECTNAFLAYMADKCTLYGMTGTHYASPSGLTESSYSTPQDMLKLGVMVAQYPDACKIWSTPDRSFSVGGNHARTLAVVNNVISAVTTPISPYYKFLGGKGGSLAYSGDDYHRAEILYVEVAGQLVALSLMALGRVNYSNIFKSAKELADMMAAELSGTTPTEGANLQALVSGSGGYAACVVPAIPAAYENLCSPADLLTRAHSVSNAPTVSRYPASTSKTMTMLCALDYIEDTKKKTLAVKSSDISSGSGSTFYAGDTLTMYDALRIMMMESSNTMANAIARTVGGIILDS